MDDFTKLVIVGVSLAVVAVVGGGIFAVEEIDKGLDKVKEKLEEGEKEVQEFWDREFRSGGPGAQGWLFMLGSDVYNPKGFRSAHQELVDNAQALFDKYGKFHEYYDTLSTNAQSILGTWRGDPALFYPNTFSIRQNLCFMPFASALSGPGLKAYEPGACQKLQDYIWSFWDKIPAISAEIAATGDSYKIEKSQRALRDVIANDEATMAALAKQNDARWRILEDRINALKTYLPSQSPSTSGTGGLTVEQKKEIGKQVGQLGAQIAQQLSSAPD